MFTDGSREEFAAGREIIQLPERDDVLDLVDEVALGQAASPLQATDTRRTTHATGGRTSPLADDHRSAAT